MIKKNELDKEFIQKLKTCFTQSAFIHIDDAGDFHILIPITAALILHDNLTDSQENPTLLAFLGHNTCKTFLEMGNAIPSIKNDIRLLILALQAINPQSEIQTHYLDYYIALLNDYREKINAFYGAMTHDLLAQPHINAMRRDFENDKASLFACRLNCVLANGYDNIRPFSFPNILFKAPTNIASDMDEFGMGPERAKLFYSAFNTKVANGETLTKTIINLAQNRKQLSLQVDPSGQMPPKRFITSYNNIPEPTVTDDTPNFHLFMIQGLFCLIFACLRPTDPDRARVALGTFASDSKKLLDVITALYDGDDTPLKTWLKLDDRIYDLILDCWQTMNMSVATSMDSSPHFDELKFIYTRERVKDSSYFIGRSEIKDASSVLYMTINPVSHWNSAAFAKKPESNSKSEPNKNDSRIDEFNLNFDKFCQRGFSTAIFAPPSLLYAIKNRDCDTIKQLIDEKPELLNKLSCDQNAYAPLHYAVCNDGDTLVINTLLELAEKHKQPINIALSTDANTTPLDLACRHENKAAIKILLPLHSKAPFAEYPKSQHPLFLAIREGKLGAVMTVIETDETLLKLTDEHNKALVFATAEHNQIAILDYLIQKNAPINTPCHSSEPPGMTPLDIATDKKNEKILTLLKANNAKSKDDPQLEDLKLFKQFKEFLKAIKDKNLTVRKAHLGFFTTNQTAVFEHFKTTEPCDLIDLLCASFLPNEISVEEVTLLIAILLLCHQKKPLRKEEMEKLMNSFLFINTWPSPLDQQVQALEESLHVNQPAI